MSGLVSYSSSDESDEDIVEEPSSSLQSETKVCGNVKKALPVPEDIRGLFNDTGSERKVSNDPKHHDGRLRSFPHEEGNWATLVFAQYVDDDFLRMQQELFLCLRPLEFQPLADYHISFSRTVTIRHHWIQDICDSLAKEFSQLEGCCCEIDGVQVLTNDEKTRSFLVLSVSPADDLLHDYISVIDTCFEQYKLQEYYKPPHFHVSIGWCLGDVTDSVTGKCNKKLKEIVERILQECSDLKYFYIDKLLMKTGNKQFVFQLDTSSNVT
ncbi:U6 snRNA phosphodiesterase 1-like [Ruditapes philippinarum]|uniref:U6 snRNA phosphodiesterase 1-like n=1 Tax=Ruditapes philippinarum TaxID=129788 RepID=UPI00295B080E|nr:U6 snRNA phosphodiesterase 1-like [Ruditapes philippinarum]